MKNIKYLLRILPYTLLAVFAFSFHYSNAQVTAGQNVVKKGIWKNKQVEYVDGYISIKIKKGINVQDISPLFAAFKATFVRKPNTLGWGIIKVPNGSDIFSTMNELKQDSLIENVEPDFVHKIQFEPNDTYYQNLYQWYLKNIGQAPPDGIGNGTPGADIDTHDAWNITQGSSDIIIAMLDTGIPLDRNTLSLDHPDLENSNRIILGADEIGDGFSVLDANAHGTNTAGIVAAETNNGIGIAGVANGCRLLIVQVFDSTGFDYFDAFADGVIYAVDHGAKVINYSGGGSVSSQADLDAIDTANAHNVLLVAASGNDGTNFVFFPAQNSSQYSNVIAVGATDDNDVRSEFSDYGPQLSVVAPGSDIWSTIPPYPSEYSATHGGLENYTQFWGTSESTPMVSGLVALILSINQNLSPSQVRSIIENSADKVSGMNDSSFTNFYGYGRVNAYNALKYTLEHYGGTIAQSFTIPSGETWTFDPGITLNFQSGVTLTVNGTLNANSNITIPSGVSLVANSGSILNFSSGTGLTVNGTLVTNGAAFTTSSQSWNGITFNSANGSSIQSTTISYASSPIIINSTSSITITACTINNLSNYYGDAIQVYSSSPTINSTIISGQTNSGNGVRFGSSSTGSLNNCTIENLGNGNGVIIQGGSSPTISGNTITNNHFHGIIVNSNGTGNPQITSNTVTNNSINNYVGIYFYSSIGVVRLNYVSGFTYGVWCRYSSSPDAGTTGQDGSNTITNNTTGIVATDNSYPNFGGGIPAKNEYWGVCNNIYGNTQYDALAETGGVINARYNWWGQYPLNPAKFYADGSSAVDNSYPETSSGNCPLVQPAYQASNTSASATISANVTSAAPSSINASTGTQTPPNISADSLIKIITEARLTKSYPAALSFCRGLLSDSSAASYHKRALSLLFNIFQSSKDSSLVNDFTKYALLKNDIGANAQELLASTYESLGKLSNAESIAKNLIAAYPNSDTEKQALFILTSLKGYDTAYTSTSASALNQLIQKYSSSIDSGLVAALGGLNNNSLARISNKVSGQMEKNIAAEKLGFQLDNYPNPFNPSTTINYQIPQPGFVILKVYDILGREVKTLVNGYQQQGKYSVNFNADNLASGVYFYRLQAGASTGSATGFISIKKMVLLK